MPNWTFNSIVCNKALAESFLTKLEEDYVLDFNKLIPMPEELNLTSGGDEDLSVFIYYHFSNEEQKEFLKNQLIMNKHEFYGNYWKRYSKEFEYYQKKIKDYDAEKIEELKEMGSKYIDNILNYGHPTWYEWCCECWGTKWNVMENVEVDDENEDSYLIRFKTAWSVPMGIVKKFADFCSDGELDWKFYDEDYDGIHYISKEDGKLIEYTEE